MRATVSIILAASLAASLQGCGDGRGEAAIRALRAVAGIEAGSCPKASGFEYAPACEDVVATMRDGTALSIKRVQVEGMPNASLQRLVLTGVGGTAWSAGEIEYPMGSGPVTVRRFVGRLAGRDVAADHVRVTRNGGGDATEVAIRFAEATVSGVPGVSGDAVMTWDKDGKLLILVPELAKDGSTVRIRMALEGAPGDAKRTLDATPDAWGKARIRDLAFEAEIVQGWGLDAAKAALGVSGPGQRVATSALATALERPRAMIGARLEEGANLTVDDLGTALVRGDAPWGIGLSLTLDGRDVRTPAKPVRAER